MRSNAKRLTASEKTNYYLFGCCGCCERIPYRKQNDFAAVGRARNRVNLKRLGFDDFPRDRLRSAALTVKMLD